MNKASNNGVSKCKMLLKANFSSLQDDFWIGWTFKCRKMGLLKVYQTSRDRSSFSFITTSTIQAVCQLRTKSQLPSWSISNKLLRSSFLDEMNLFWQQQLSCQPCHLPSFQGNPSYPPTLACRVKYMLTGYGPWHCQIFLTRWEETWKFLYF